MKEVGCVPFKNGKKMLYELWDGAIIEVAVFSYQGTEQDGVHICMPSQVGCPVGCLFCATTYAPIPFQRNLFQDELCEIIDSIQAGLSSELSVDVISFSGHGEPLLNYDAVSGCLKHYETNIGRGFITTVGINSVLEKIMDSGISPCQFFLSLHGSSDAERRLVIPQHTGMARMSDLKRFAEYLLLSNQTVTFNYMLTENNTDVASARRLCSYLAGIGSVSVRFTPVFPIDGTTLPKLPDNMDRFLEEFALLSTNTNVSWRLSRPTGSEIGIACGQMRAHKMCKEVHHAV